MPFELVKAIPADQQSTQIVRVGNGWVLYPCNYGFDMANGRVQAPQLVFNRMSDAVAALIEWGRHHEAA